MKTPSFKGANKRLAQDAEGGGVKLRIWSRRQRGLKTPRLLIKCGDCDESLEIHYDEYGLEINGVNATIEEWRRVLLPLLNVPPK